jgi:hypothetical protein
MKKFIIILLAVTTLGVSSCEKWLDINKNPNDATTATPDLILAGVLTNWSSDVSSLTTLTGAWMGYWMHAGGWSGWYSEKKYEITANYLNLYGTSSAYGYYRDPLTDTRFIRLNSGTNVVYPAITDVVDAWYYSRLVDVYGDVPYTEACQPDKTLTPKYDDDEAIYLDLITRLDNAMAAFNNKLTAPDASTNSIYAFKTSVDVINGGDFSKWLKFANTLKLRLVMRMTNVRTAAQLKAMMDNTVAYGFITANITGSPGYSNSSGKTNPMWNTFGKDYTGVVTSANTQYALNKYIHTKLTYLADPRLAKYFFAPSSAPSGSLVSTRFGTDGDLTVQPNTTVAGNYSWVYLAADWTSKQTGNGALDRSVLLTYTESLFLQSEAASRGVITTTTASAAYTAGITASLTSAKVVAADQVTYLAQTLVTWNAAWTPAQQIENIINQKYIANYFLNFFESYCDYRRTGYPNPKKPAAAYDPNAEMLSYYPGGVIRRQIPRIIPYPQGDYDINKANVQAAIDKQGVPFTTDKYPFDARIFWDTAPLTITY